MSVVQIEAGYKLETRGPLHIGTGRGAAGVQRGMLRDNQGLPYIPGSTIKGRTRYAAIRICQWLGLDPTTDTVADKLPRFSNDKSVNGPHGMSDLPSMLFGSAWHPCKLRFTDAKMHNSQDAIWSSGDNEAERRNARLKAHGNREIRAGITRSRVLGTVGQGRLFHTEVAPPGLIFQGGVSGSISIDGDPLPNEEGKFDILDIPEVLVLWLSLHLMVADGVGGSKSAGCGQLQLAAGQKIDFKLNGQSFEPVMDNAAATLELLTDLRPGGDV